MNIIEIINKKKNKEILSKDEIFFFINEYANDKIPSYQVSALLMAITINGMNLDETYYLTDAMMHSGKILNLDEIPFKKLDKHSTGGVGDKISLILGPIIACFNAKFAKMSGRGLGHTGGTIDKLESIDGFNCFLNDEEFKALLKKQNIAIIGQSEDLVPADKKIYALRDVTSTVDSLPLIASSIMSKKLATGADVILLDIKCGAGAFMKDLDQAKKLGLLMVEIGKKFNKNINIEITNMEQPLGRCIGNKNEVLEAIEALKGNGETMMMDVVFQSCITLLKNIYPSLSNQQIKNEIDNAIKTHKALNVFYDWISSQNGNIELLKDPLSWWKPKYKKELKANKEGFIYLKNSINLGLISLELGAGRKTKEDKIDFEAGIVFNKVSNEKVNNNDVIATFYSSKEIDDSLIQKAWDSIEINNAPKEIKMILKSI